MRGIVTALLALATVAYSHGNHDQEDTSVETDWATRHMKEEHHVNNFDPASFFTLHDYDNSGDWSPDEIRKTYGLQDPSNSHVTESQKEALVRDVLSQFDPAGTGSVSRDEWMRQSQAGKRLPDFGYGPGHHGDIEYEYEIHHFEKYHSEDSTEEELNHPEDIEHFKLHDEMDLAQERLEKLESMQIVEANIPQKFFRSR
ncbi:uncharacterized protein TRUGW13939_05634 [Talaromyces rugulosus]|uniref:EF-hand domain-containing protein n=1 Tax=Talaromyces rugulosus TaxID=121627 RepID=A0A7H8QWQ0_TALRU|nr:uncharacterized protein TRUGW13939_05634 [Talaromyces rugulosus]QKX58510.1 hypothetical protein TRUGW13939_05634 [Talaromyces rugulosus]